MMSFYFVMNVVNVHNLLDNVDEIDDDFFHSDEILFLDVHLNVISMYQKSWVNRLVNLTID